MQCYSKKKISYINFETGRVQVATVRCGKCIACMLHYSQEWAIRCVMERTLHSDACCVTLTYDDEHLPPNESLYKPDVQRFLKRLRKKHSVRYFGCGEYGSTRGRPHYHIILFGYDFPDKRYFKHTDAGNVYVSKELSELWYLGFATVGEFSQRTAFYCAKYLNKLRSYSDKVTKPFTVMSLKPSIGYGAFSFKELERGTIFINGNEYLLPRSFYQSLKRQGVEFTELKERRMRYVQEVNSIEQEDLEYFSSKKCEEILDKLLLL